MILLALLISAGPVSRSHAHHAFAAVFNGDDTLDVRGTVTKLEWMNPHTWFYVDVVDDRGTVENWAFEMGSPNGLIRRGWSRATLQVGQEVRIQGYRAKDGSRQASVKGVTLSDGRELSGASSKEEP
jgi:hypothetical protein